jgi:hypothetical protein
MVDVMMDMLGDSGTFVDDSPLLRHVFLRKGKR